MRVPGMNREKEPVKFTADPLPKRIFAPEGLLQQMMFDAADGMIYSRFIKSLKRRMENVKEAGL